MDHAVPKPAAIRTTGERSPRGKSRKWIVIVAAVVALVGLGIFWNNVGRDLVWPRKWGVVEQGKLYRSGQISPRLLEPVFRDNNIKAIVALSDDGPNVPEQIAEENAAKAMNIDRQVFPLLGNGTGDIKNYARAIAMIDRCEREGKPVLVHCVAGTQRTGGVVSMYEILVNKKSPDAMLPELKRYGWDHGDNPDLLPYLNSNMKELAELLVQMKIIDKVPDPLPVINNK